MMDPTVRLDSLDPQRGPRSFRFDGLRAVVRADAIGDVLPALRAVEDAVADGLHAAGFVAYEAAPAFDPALATRPADPRQPLEQRTFNPLAVGSSPARPMGLDIPLLWFALYEHRIEADRDELTSEGDASLGELRPDVAEDDYAANVERIRELIAAGDTYQVNYTFRLGGAFEGSPLALYRRLCDAQQAAFCAYVDFGEGVIVSASPELFFRWGGGELELRPMKGTRPRGRWLEEDREQARELAASPKDRAENLMIVDLLRNDAGRIAEFGSVRVERMFEVEPYPTVLQMTSTVRARTPPETRLTDVFRALFPCGSITGAPKVRTSQIIAELETSPRGVYTGAIGFVSPGEALFSVAIRTLVIDHATGEAELGVGSGVTYDSTAADEYRECLSKAAFVHHEPPPALLETFGWAPETGFVRLEAHLGRMARSAEYFGHPFDADTLRRRLDTLAPEMPREPRRVRVELSPRGEIAVAHSAMSRWEEPVRLALARRHIPSEHPFWYHKTADRARYESPDPVAVEHDQVLLVNERGELAETPIANLVVDLDGALWTPHLDAGLLPGVLRAELLRAGTIRERELSVADLERATALWVINSLRGWGRAVIAATADGESARGAGYAVPGAPSPVTV